MATDKERIRQLEKRVEELTGQLEQVTSDRIRLEVERNQLIRSRDGLGDELAEVRAELDRFAQQRPVLTFDQLGSQLRQGLAAVDDAGTPGGPRYRTEAASFELKVAVDSDGEQATLRLPTLGDTVDPGLLGTLRLELGRAGADDPDLSGLVLVPSLAGSSADGAADRLARAGLTVGATTARPAFAPPGSVVAQDPEHGSYVEPGTPIDVVLAAAEVDVPDVVGLRRDAAAERLAAVRLRVGDVTEHPDEAETGTVLAQRPEPGGRIVVGGAVDLEIAAPARRTVPDLVGSTPGEAKGSLAEIGLVLGRVVERSGGGPPGRIVDQTPPAGDDVELGTAVSVIVARQRLPRARPVPEVVGLAHDRAVEVLEADEFAARVTGTRPHRDGDDPARFGTVAAQEPPAGERTVEPVVGLVLIASGAPVDTITGVGRARARRLEEAGLATVGDVANAEVERLAEALGIGPDQARALRDQARERNVPTP